MKISSNMSSLHSISSNIIFSPRAAVYTKDTKITNSHRHGDLIRACTKDCLNVERFQRMATEVRRSVHVLFALVFLQS